MKRERAIFWQMAVIVLLFSLAVTGCGAAGGAPSDSKTEYVIRLGHSDTRASVSVHELQAGLGSRGRCGDREGPD